MAKNRVHLTITINAEDYTVVPQGISHHNDCPSYLLKKNGTYLEFTIQVTNVGVSCSCPEFRRRHRDDGPCEHIGALQVFYMLR